jgi:peptidoglycan/LPS O-acetylase OafA/YrhL
MSSAKYIKSLDGVRAIAALLVLVFHFSQYAIFQSDWGKILQKIGYLGQTGVSLFFVLSGFLITRILFDQLHSPHYWKNFIIRRSLRIFPLYYLYLTCEYFIVPFLTNTPSPDISLQWYYWFYLQDFATTFHWPSAGPKHFWSLAVEEHFYLIWPFIVLYYKITKIIQPIIAVLIISAVVRFLLAYFGYQTYFFTLARMDEIALGALLAWMERKQLLSFFQGKPFFAALLIMAGLSVILWGLFSSDGLLILQVFKYNLISILYFLMIGKVITLDKQHWLSKILCSPFFNYTGKISYGLYVYQATAVIWGLTHGYAEKPLLFLGSLIFFCYLIATISYYLFEQPILKLKGRFTYSSLPQ